MRDEVPQPPRPRPRSSFSRKLSFPSRVRSRVREIGDRVLAADLGWSATFVVVVVALLGSQRCAAPLERYVVGEPAPHDIVARYDFDVEDHALTEERRQQAREAVPDVYVRDSDREVRVAREIAELFAEGRAAGAVQPSGVDALSRVPPDALRVLEGRDWDPAIEEVLTTSVRRVMRGMIVGNKALLQSEPAIEVLHVPGSREERLTDYGAIMDLDEARDRVRREVSRMLDLPGAEEVALGRLAAVFVDTNLAYSPEQTRERRDRAAQDAIPVMQRVAKGTVLVRDGERITAHDLEIIGAARRGSVGRMGVGEFAGLVVTAVLLAFFLYRYASYHQRDFKRIRHLHALLVLSICSMLLLASGLLWVARQVVDQLAPPFDLVETYPYLVPLGAGSVLVALLANGRIAMVYSAFTALLFGMLTGWDTYRLAWGLLVQFAGIYAISTYRNRAALLRAGLVIGGAGAVACLALETLRGSPEPTSVLLYASALAFVGGAVGAGLLVSFSLPPLETLFNVLTEIRLLELSNVDHPLLSQLAVKAPGSYNHSLVVGTLAEEAAKAIGANSLFCRVAAFYHDVGKMVKPEYFVENQRGENPHDRLSPSMSALIIASHVKDGIRMAREAGLPEQIVDIIPQHHGTRLMTYFYEKAKKNADPDLGEIKQEDFRYPGPKPQNREAAIFMLSDAVEAAARTVDDPTPNRLREMIRKVTNAVVLDGQLEACDLTFADLDRIQAAFLRALVSMYHHRVDYPGFDFGKGRPAARTEREPAATRSE